MILAALKTLWHRRARPEPDHIHVSGGARI
jgi:hypothetical protein